MTGAAAPLSVGSVTQLTLSLLCIVALIFALSWFLKRLKLVGPRSRGELAIIDQLTVGPRERIVLVRVGEGQVLVGIGPGGMIGLAPLPTPIVLKGAPPAPVFADRLRELLKGTGAGA